MKNRNMAEKKRKGSERKPGLKERKKAKSRQKLMEKEEVRLAEWVTSDEKLKHGGEK